MTKESFQVQNRVKLLESIEAFKVCYPGEACRQFRALRHVWKPLQHGLGFDLSIYFNVKHYEDLAASFAISKIRGILQQPKNFVKHFYGWDRSKAAKFPNVRILPSVRIF